VLVAPPIGDSNQAPGPDDDIVSHIRSCKNRYQASLITVFFWKNPEKGEKMNNNQEMEKFATDSRRYWNLWQALRGIAS
jgi:hypothetical protein